MIQIYCTQAFPKVNISLKIGEKRGNLHTLQSRFCLVVGGIYDSMMIVKGPFNYTSNHTSNYTLPSNHNLNKSNTCYSEAIQYNENARFYLYGKFDCKLQDNLIYKAYRSLLQPNQKIKPASLHIMVSKKIPSGGGLGGGSANAALTLLVLNEILELNYNIDTLLSCAKALGSDVAFFLMIYTQNSAGISPYFFIKSTENEDFLQEILSTFETNGVLCENLIESLELKRKNCSIKFLSANVFGVGEKIEPFYEKLPQFLIHCNKIACNTAAVYGEFARLRLKGQTANNIDLGQDSITLLQKHSMRELNDLYEPARNLYDLDSIARGLYSVYDNLYFSGSGSSFFSIKQS